MVFITVVAHGEYGGVAAGINGAIRVVYQVLNGSAVAFYGDSFVGGIADADQNVSGVGVDGICVSVGKYQPAGTPVTSYAAAA